jgi:16S rRNA (guanine527-N7)-methyltransferase
MQDLLKSGLEGLGLDPAQQPCDQYLAYIALLSKWNKSYNLTAIKQPEQMLSRHILDSLSVASFIEGERCLDVGSGAGLPGMILALLQPEIHWTLLDSNQKKVRFLRHVKAELRVENVEIIHSRVENFNPEQDFDTVICRAVAPLVRLLEQTKHLITKDTQLLAMKGKQVSDEIDQLGHHEFLIKVNDLPLSDADSSAKLVQVRQIG